mmetsp:Transcript_6015/g.23367  ORF Transcript_6015/g.23367 Transcript_6015/m.23367 type:complete len:235 (+) Transcript_6015:2201-2905(+)
MPYAAAMLARSACAVQMLLVALSRRMCCSRVCIAIRSAGFPWRSTLTPIRRPGRRRECLCPVAMKPACGPPNPSGTPKRCAEPTAMSAPMSPGLFSSVSARRSVAQTTSVPCAWHASTNSLWSSASPKVLGYCTSTPAYVSSARSAFATSPTTTSTPLALPRVWMRAMVCGWQSSATKNLLRFLEIAMHMFMASAAAVASSRSEALAISMPVRSATIVWKFSSICKRPCEISAW